MSQFFKTFAALQNRNFCFFFVGQSISFIGSWMQVVVQGWVIFQLTHSAAAVGLTGFFGVIPVVALALIGGGLVDTVSARTMLLVTGFLGVIQATLFCLLVVFGHPSPVAIYALSFAWGVINGFDAPARFTFIKNIVGKNMLFSAYALNGILVGIGFICGPSIGGYLVAMWGAGATFALNALSFIPLLLFLLFFIKVNAAQKKEFGGTLHVLQGTIVGVRFCMTDPSIAPLMAALGVAITFGFSYRGILPVVAAQLHLGPRGFGWLSAAPGIGTIIVSTIISRFSARMPVNHSIFIGMIFTGVALVSFSSTTGFPMAMILLIIAGMGIDTVLLMVQGATGKMASEEMTGRVMGCGASIMFLGTAVGYAAIGYTAQYGGAFTAIRCFGGILIAAAIAFATFNKRR